MQIYKHTLDLPVHLRTGLIRFILLIELGLSQFPGVIFELIDCRKFTCTDKRGTIRLCGICTLFETAVDARDL